MADDTIGGMGGTDVRDRDSIGLGPDDGANLRQIITNTAQIGLQIATIQEALADNEDPNVGMALDEFALALPHLDNALKALVNGGR